MPRSVAVHAKKTAKKTIIAVQTASQLAAIPDDSTVLTVLNGVVDACNGIQVHHDEIQSLAKYVEELIQAFSEDQEGRRGPQPHARTKKILERMEIIKKDVDEWKSYSFIKACLHRKRILDTCEEHKKRLDDLKNMFFLSQWAEAKRILESKLQNLKEPERLELHSKLSKIAALPDGELLGIDNKPVTRPELEAQCKAVQEMMNDRSGRLRLAESEIEKADEFGVMPEPGSHSDLARGYYKGRNGNQKVAIKMLKGVEHKRWLLQFHNALKIWRDLDHKQPHILGIIGYTTAIDNTLSLVSPWMENGNILQYCRDHQKEADRLHLLVGAASGLKYLHNLFSGEKCVHSRVKASNILVNNEFEAVICDFQMAKVVQSLEITSNKTDTYTRAAVQRWAAPEASRDLTPAPPRDVWAFGMAMIEVFTLQQPFPEIIREEQVLDEVAKGRKPKRPDVYWVTDEVWCLMQDCWEGAPEDRPTMNDVHHRLLEAEQYRKKHPSSPEQHIPQTIYDRHAHLDPMRL